ncbi:hypothetical protein L9F63_022890, partial [Diploptera punctata]
LLRFVHGQSIVQRLQVRSYIPIISSLSSTGVVSFLGGFLNPSEEGRRKPPRKDEGRRNLPRNDIIWINKNKGYELYPTCKMKDLFKTSATCQLLAKVKDSIFEGFDNLIGTKNSSNIVPNYVHFLFFGNPRISYVHSVCILAAFRNQKPERIYFHTNIKEFKGPHWIKIRDTLGSVLHFANVTLPTEIFGHKFTRPYHVYHASDVTRIRILMEYGGIFLDNDSYIVKSLDPFRRYEMTIGVTNGEYLGTQVLIAHKDARFLKLWLESYRDYQAHSFYFNAGEKPMVEIIRRKPELVHSIRYSLGVEGLTRNLYVWDTWSNWRRYYSIHLMIRHRRYMDTLWNYLQGRKSVRRKNVLQKCSFLSGANSRKQ